ncbi:MAG: hypothetical protein JO362_09085, partial [Streptomycetaceae bacterium]|nr:hypothetical protein [Streptomycetaceae bacterium]
SLPGPGVEVGWSPQDLPLSPWDTTWDTTLPTVLDAGWTPQADDAAQHLPHTAGPAGTPHATPPSSYAREHPVLDPGDDRPAKQARWAPAHTADQPELSSMPGPSSVPEPPAPWPVTHTWPALADTPGPSSSLPHPLPPDWVANLLRDLGRKNHRAGSGRLANALRALIQTTYLKPGTHLSGRKLAHQLPKSKIRPDAVRYAYAELRNQGLLIMKKGHKTRIAGPVEFPMPTRPADWLERLHRELEDGRWFEQVLRTHVLSLRPHTSLPPHGELTELLGIPEVSDTRVLDAYSRLAEDGLLVRGDHNDMLVADHGGLARPVTSPRASQRAGATRSDAGDPGLELPVGWVETLRGELEKNPFNPRSDHEKIIWFVRALETHIQGLECRTRLPSFVQLAAQLKSVGVNNSLVQRAYTRLKKTGKVTSEFGNGKGTWVAPPRNVADFATGLGLPQAWIGHGEPPLLMDPLPDIPELDETQLRELPEFWDALDDEEPRAAPPIVPGAGRDPQTDRAAQETGHLTNPSHLLYLPSPDVHDILSLLSPDWPTTATRPELRHLPWQGPGNAAAPTPPSSDA